MPYFEPYAIAAALFSIILIVSALRSQGALRNKLLLFCIFLDAVFALMALTLGVPGFFVAWILLFPFCIAFFAYIFGKRAHGLLKNALLTFALCLGLALILDGVLLAPELIADPAHIYSLDTFAKFMFLAAELIILASSLVVTAVVVLVILAIRLSKRKR
jgi:hypothetical protein